MIRVLFGINTLEVDTMYMSHLRQGLNDKLRNLGTRLHNGLSRIIEASEPRITVGHYGYVVHNPKSREEIVAAFKGACRYNAMAKRLERKGKYHAAKTARQIGKRYADQTDGLYDPALFSHSSSSASYSTASQ